MASEIRVNKIENRSGLGTVTFADTGVDLAGIVTATTFSGSGASLTALPAAQLSGTLPAISAASLTNVPAANVVGVHTSLTVTNATTTGTAIVGGGVTISESGIEASGIGITVANINGAQVGGRRNLIMNGAMQVAQRGTSTTMSGSSSTYLCDRWRVKTANADNVAMTISQDATSYPTDFRQCLKIDITTAETTLDSNEYLQVQQRIEAQNLQHLNNGTSSAKSTVLSFYVKAYQAGNYVVAIYKGDNTQRLITLPYTINASATWERKVLVIPGDTSGSGIDNNTGHGFQLDWFLAAGSDYTSTDSTSWINYASAGYAYGQAVNTMSSTDNYWQITGVQLEVGSQATSFEHRSRAEELTLCYRYFHRIKPATDYAAYGVGGAYSNTQAVAQIHFPVPLRASPTFSYNGALSTYYDVVGGFINFSNMTVSQVMGSPEVTSLKVNVVGNGTAGNTFMLATYNNTTTYLDFDSEL